MGRDQKIRVRLHGRFRVSGAGGAVLTPKGAKAQGLLALLLTCDDFERGRLWLQDKLWSDRGAAQGAASLRQALSEIRRALGDHAAALQADRQAVRLDPELVEIEPGGGEFLEGLDIRDAEFNIWLSSERAASPGPETPPPPVRPARQTPARILFLGETDRPGVCQMVERMFIDRVARSLRENINVEILSQPPAAAPPGLILASVQAFDAAGGVFGLRVSVEDIDTNRVIWSEMEVVRWQGAPGVEEMPMLALANRATMSLKAAVLERPAAQRGDPDANLLAILAVRKIFTLRAPELAEAETLLMQAHDIAPRGVYKSWLAQLYSIQFIERFKTLAEVRDKSAAACAHAMEQEPDNSHVLASVADASLVIQRNFARSAQLAQMSVEANPSNPLAWWSLASGNLYLGNGAAAHRAAANAQRLAAGTRIRFWADSLRGLTAVVNGKIVEGIRNLESSSALSPGFRPPLRYLTALYSAAGLSRSALDTAARLTQVEPDFSFDRLGNDPEYPVSLMRKHGMLDTIRLDQ